jgi:hypothetical protein
MTKQKSLVKYIMTRIYQAKSTGLPINPDQATIEHLAPEHPAKGPALPPEAVASIGNLVLVNQGLNNQLANKDFGQKVKILQKAKVWVDPIILKAATWSTAEIEQRTRLLAKEAYDKAWNL